MIEYRQGGVYILCRLFQCSGSTFPVTIFIALPCALLAAAVQFLYPDGNLRLAVFGVAPDAGGVMTESQAWSGFSFLVGFLIVFRTSQAYGRFWEGCTASHQMRAEWFDAGSSLVSFCKASQAPPATIASFKELLIRLISMLHAAALAELEAGDDKLSGERFLWAHTYDLIDPSSVDAASIETMRMSECRVELIFEWIQQLIVENIGSGVLCIPAPILSRAFQELSNGMVAYHDAMKISHIPFPFPYAQSCDCLLVFHWILVPLVTSQWVTHPFWAAIFTFVQVFILWTLNLIAIEIDNPFGRDKNDIDASRMQEEINQHLKMLLLPSTERTPKLVSGQSPGEVSDRLHNRRQSFVELFGGEEVMSPAGGRTPTPLQITPTVTPTHGSVKLGRRQAPSQNVEQMIREESLQQEQKSGRSDGPVPQRAPDIESALPDADAQQAAAGAATSSVVILSPAEVSATPAHLNPRDPIEAKEQKDREGGLPAQASQPDAYSSSKGLEAESRKSGVSASRLPLNDPFADEPATALEKTASRGRFTCGLLPTQMFSLNSLTGSPQHHQDSDGDGDGGGSASSALAIGKVTL
mmetsp:Transcript_39521/g.92964  ORF Transcript_39521/g.92964 Transcript_39521/m.92964 type:complete len:583 (+) Transcript_39521:142-1890(+)